MNRKQFINYLVSYEVTDDWITENEKDLKNIVGYIWNAFIYNPQALKYLNKHMNTYDYNSFSLKDKILFIQKVIIKNGLLASWLNTSFQPRIDRIKELELYKELSDNDRRSIWHLANEYGLLELNKANDVANKPMKLTQQDKQRIEASIKEAEELNSKTRILKELNQKIIDELELSLFDISVLESRNQIQYVFLDKDNKKVVYREQFKMKIKFHPSNSIFEKDYFEQFANLYEYEFDNIWNFNAFKKALNESFLNSLKV